MITEFPDIGIEPYYEDKWRRIYCMDCRVVLSLLPRVISTVVTDPPYELGFMGKSWDSKGVSFQPETWEAVRRACLPGAPMLAFGGTRTQHRIGCAIEDGGWEIRDCLIWCYGSGFPKSLDISKAIDKVKGVEREKVLATGGLHKNRNLNDDNWCKIGEDSPVMDSNTPVTSEAQLWNGYGTSLKPSYEPIILSMNPLDGTFANNALKHGVAGLNIDGCRVPTDGRDKEKHLAEWERYQSKSAEEGRNSMHGGLMAVDLREFAKEGRFPANFLHDGSDEVLELFPQTGKSSGGGMKDLRKGKLFFGDTNPNVTNHCGFGDNGSAARFFYCAKASPKEREKGLDSLPDELYARSGGAQGARDKGEETYLQSHIGLNRITKVKNNHPTVKPLALMEYLCKLVKMPEYNLILDPFCGSGTTLLACTSLGVPSIGIDSDEKSCEIAASRCSADAVERIQKGEY